MITEPLTSEVGVAPTGAWAAILLDSDGRVPDGDEVNVRQWHEEMTRAAAILGHLNRPGILVIVHPSGYGRG